MGRSQALYYLRVVGALPPALYGASTSWLARLPTSGPNRQLSAGGQHQLSGAPANCQLPTSVAPTASSLRGPVLVGNRVPRRLVYALLVRYKSTNTDAEGAASAPRTASRGGSYMRYWYSTKSTNTDAEGARVVGALPPALCASWQARQARHGTSAYVKHTLAYVTYADVC